MNQMNSLKVEKAFFKKRNQMILRYVITENSKPLDEVYRWLDLHSINSYLTGKEYAYVLLKYLKFLKKLNLHYREVTQKATLESYIKYLLYGDNDITRLDGNMSLASVKRHLCIIKNFYDWLEDNTTFKGNPVRYGNQKNSKGKTVLKSRFLYGQIWEFDFENSFMKKLRYKTKQNHIKWYSQEEIDNFHDNLPSTRDKVIYRISVETGARIGEILGLRLGDFDPFDGWLHIRKYLNIENEAQAKTNERSLTINEKLIEDIQLYISGERASVDTESDYLFVNLKGEHTGLPMKPRNFLKIMKNTARKIGLNPEEIRTHSGRSTRVQELIEASRSDPRITETFIMEEMGWSSPESIKAYKKAFSITNRKEVLNNIEDKVNKNYQYEEDDSNDNS